MKFSGVDGVIIQCGYGDDVVSQDDNRFHYNMQEAIRAGLEVGVYLYSYAMNTVQAESEARHALRLCKPYADYIKNFVWLDLEEPTQGIFAKSALKIFANYLNANGFEVGVYSGLSYYQQNLSDISGYPLWIASYGIDDGQPGIKPNVGECIWQFTSRGKVKGINGNVDVNYDYREANEDMTKEQTEQVCNDMIYRYNKPINDNIKYIQAMLKDLTAEVKSLKTKVSEVQGQFEVYQRFDEVPEWGKKSLRKAIDKGIHKGTDKGLDIPAVLLRTLVELDRLGLLD